MKSQHKNSLSEALQLIESPSGLYFKQLLEQKVYEAVKSSRGETSGEVVSAVFLTQKEKALLIEKITQIFHREVELNFRVDKNVLGGFRIIIGDWKLAATLSTQLTQLQKNLTQ